MLEADARCMMNAVTPFPEATTTNHTAALEIRPPSLDQPAIAGRLGKPPEQSSPHPWDRYVNKRELAAIIGVSVRSIDNFLAAGLVHFRLTARCIRFDVTEVRAWMKERYATQRIGPANSEGKGRS